MEFDGFWISEPIAGLDEVKGNSKRAQLVWIALVQWSMGTDKSRAARGLKSIRVGLWLWMLVALRNLIHIGERQALWVVGSAWSGQSQSC